MHAERKHGGWKHHHIVNAHGIHGALAELDLAMQPGRSRLGQRLLVHDAAGHVLIERAIGVQQTRRRTRTIAEGLRDVAQNVVVDALGDFRPERYLVDMGIDIDNEPVLELLRHRRGLGQIIARVGARGNLLQLADAGRGFANVHGANPLSRSPDAARGSLRELDFTLLAGRCPRNDGVGGLCPYFSMMDMKVGGNFPSWPRSSRP